MNIDGASLAIGIFIGICLGVGGVSLFALIYGGRE